MRRVIGFAVGTAGEQFVTVDKIAVSRQYRRLAIKHEKNLLMIIPETHLPEAGLWAKAEGFRPAARPIVRDYYTICGDPVDGVAFTYEMHHANKQAST